jgi:hypothetical protein
MDAVIAAGSIASTAALDHCQAETSGAGTTPAWTAQRQLLMGTRSRPAAWLSLYSLRGVRDVMVISCDSEC